MLDVRESLPPIRLAGTPPFRVGSVEVDPATRQVVHNEQNETLEPRIMRVLVALAEAEGRIVSHDELIARCWDGRVVGENAIHRVISRLRDLGLTLGDAFRIETITKVGYRLIANGRFSPSEPQIAWPRNRLWLLGVIAALIAAATAALIWRSPAGERVPTIAIVAEREAAETLAGELSTGLTQFADARSDQLSFVDAGSSSDADYLIRLNLERQPAHLRASALLLDRTTGEILWSFNLERNSPEEGGLGEQLAAQVGQIVNCLTGSAGPQQLDRATLRLYLAACANMAEFPIASLRQGDRQMALLRQVTRRAPRFARAWAELALAEAMVAQYPAVPEKGRLEKRALIDAARVHIAQARALDQDLGAIYVAESALAGRRQWADRLAIEQRGLSVDPTYAPLHAVHSQTLESLGYANAALESARRAVALDPLSPAFRNVLISRLAYAGRLDEAGRELGEAERIWPNSEAIRDVRYRFHLRVGDPAEALRMIDAGEVDDHPFRGRNFLNARLDPTPAKLSPLRATSRQVQTRTPAATAVQHLQMLGQFGWAEDAYRLLEVPAVVDAVIQAPEIFFRAPMRSIRRDRRFMHLAARLGLLDHWISSGRWPDFCLEPDLPYDCRAEAAKITNQRIG